ncbi:MAG: hypothetical protein ACODAU_08390 [Myxococcota bacterium]
MRTLASSFGLAAALLLAACASETNGPGPSESPSQQVTSPSGDASDEASTPPSDGEAAQPSGDRVVGDAPCETDADCVPASCCHASACVAADDAPDCDGVFCTQECRGGTIDCGGGCVCDEGRCTAELNDLGSEPAVR